MPSLKLKIIAIAHFINRTLKTETIYQIKNGSYAEWITSDEWFKRQKLKEQNKYYLGGTNANTEQEIKRILSLSNSTTNDKSKSKT